MTVNRYTVPAAGQDWELIRVVVHGLADWLGEWQDA